MKKTSYFYCVAICCFYFPHLFAQGPISGFMPQRGELAVALAYSYESFDRYFQAEGAIDRDLIIRSYNAYVEYGINEYSSLVGTLPYIYTTGDNRGLQDASLWLKYRSSYAEVPTGTSSFITAVGLSVPVSNYPTEGEGAIGQRATIFQGRLVYQFNHESGWFISGQSGLDFQLAPESVAVWPLLIRTGFGARYFYLEGWLELVRSLDNSDAMATAIANAASSWTRTGGTLYVPITPWLGVVGGGAYVLSGEFIGQATRWNLGMVWKFLPRPDPAR